MEVKHLFVRLGKQEHGSFTLEALLIAPLFLASMCVMITMVRMVATEMIIQHAVSDVVKLAAVQIYPLEPMVSSLTDKFSGWVDELPQPIAGMMQDGRNMAEKELWKQALQVMLNEHLKESNILQKEVMISDVFLPGTAENGHKMFGATVSCSYHVRLPFYHRTWLIRKQAFERVWTGG